MPLKYWDEAFLVATYLINRLPTKVLDFLHALDKLIQEKPNYAGLVGYTCLVVCAGHSSPFQHTKTPIPFQSMCFPRV
jgi:hypothetical protein